MDNSRYPHNQVFILLPYNSHFVLAAQQLISGTSKASQYGAIFPNKQVNEQSSSPSRWLACWAHRKEVHMLKLPDWRRAWLFVFVWSYCLLFACCFFVVVWEEVERFGRSCWLRMLGATKGHPRDHLNHLSRNGGCYHHRVHGGISFVLVRCFIHNSMPLGSLFNPATTIGVKKVNEVSATPLKQSSKFCLINSIRAGVPAL